MYHRNPLPMVFLFIGLVLLIAGLLTLIQTAGATPLDDGQYQVSYVQQSNGQWVMDLRANHPAENARLGTAAELEQAFPCQHQAVNHFYFLLGRLYGFTLAPFPAPPGGC